MDNFVYAKDEQGLSREEIRAALLSAIEGRELKNVLIIPPDFTRFHSNAGYITNVYYHALTERGCNVDILPALGTHVPVTRTKPSSCSATFPTKNSSPTTGAPTL